MPNSTVGIRKSATDDETPNEILTSVKTNKNGMTCMKNASNTITSQSAVVKRLIMVIFIRTFLARHVRHAYLLAIAQ